MSLTPQAVTGLALFSSVIGFTFLMKRATKQNFAISLTAKSYITSTATPNSNNIRNNLISKMDAISSSSISSSTMSIHDFSSLNSDEKIRSYWLSKDSDNSFLEDILSNESLSWVQKQNKYCLSAIGKLMQCGYDFCFYLFPFI